MTRKRKLKPPKSLTRGGRGWALIARRSSRHLSRSADPVIDVLNVVRDKASPESSKNLRADGTSSRQRRKTQACPSAREVSWSPTARKQLELLRLAVLAVKDGLRRHHAKAWRGRAVTVSRRRLGRPGSRSRSRMRSSCLSPTKGWRKRTGELCKLLGGVI